MAHGSPRVQICEECNIYGLIPRFDKNECPECKKETKSIDRYVLKKRLDLLITDEVPMSFKFRDAGNKI